MIAKRGALMQFGKDFDRRVLVSTGEHINPRLWYDRAHDIHI